MPLDTADIRQLAYDAHLDRTPIVIHLLCDILDELRANAKNRQEALKSWPRQN